MSERPRRSREEGASLLSMIPLERWNVERSCTSRAKSTKDLDGTSSLYAPLLANWNGS